MSFQFRDADSFHEGCAVKSFFNVVAGVLFIVAFLPYIWAIVHKMMRRFAKLGCLWQALDRLARVCPQDKPTQPVKASWIVWATLDYITFAGMYVQGCLNAQISAAIVTASFALVLAMKYGLPGWKVADIFCLVGAVLGIVLWALFDSPILAIATSLSVVFVGSIPTFMSAWEDPRRENFTAWTIFWISCVFALLAVPQWTIQDAAQPVGFFAVETTMMVILLTRKFIKPIKAN